MSDTGDWAIQYTEAEWAIMCHSSEHVKAKGRVIGRHYGRTREDMEAIVQRLDNVAMNGRKRAEVVPLTAATP